MNGPPLASSFLQDESFRYVLYIIAFSLFIQGLRGLAGPTTAVRGNRIAAVGMAIAIVATLLAPLEGNWGLIALGIALGTAVGVPAARQVQMTAMPQMVALFNGVGGGAVFLIAWVEFRESHGFDGVATYITISACSRRSSGRSPSGARTSPSASSRKSSRGARSRSARASRSSTCFCSYSRSPAPSTSPPGITPKRSSSES